MAVWSDYNTEPKRGFRFLVHINSIPQWIVKKVTKPEFTIKNTVHKYLNHTFNYPGGAEWGPITLEMVDPVNPDASKTLQNILRASGYHFPLNPDDVTTLSKAASCKALGSVIIDQIGADGVVIEEWELRNAWVESVKYGELSYDSEDLTTISLTLRYDYALQISDIGGNPIAVANA